MATYTTNRTTAEGSKSFLLRPPAPTTSDANADVVVSLIDERSRALVDAVETRRVYDFRLPRGHVGRRSHPRSLSLS